ncbi:putative protein-glutamate methylesterase [Leptospira broomii serovar Hurstbridge str. 5399]|uniref:Protein-glutamate methylesterase/protein-glutamine glutaminase n=1 Tax=Leptospira broomii serovar Hurstbridge str. 5399 TaxID=1049789 RepID=T0F7K5_9LEPT|nr:chemotaxis-specific protein-glutamate methyltransferase CheB [Leptospira broomii]EQA43487.1 putative protein-glutamate methylesterase [Leptospira broomii serovar Hurstbridge str. 5399]
MGHPMELTGDIKKISVLAVDDSLVYRNLLRAAFSQDPEIEFLGAAIDGKYALPKIAHLKPDFVILDVEMPEMNGIETLREIKANYPATNVIMLSSLTMEGAKVTIKAMEMGALDFVSKPDGLSESAERIGEALEQLTAKIKAIHAQNYSKAKNIVKIDSIRRIPKSSFKRKYAICAIGISTGGPQSLRDLFSRISTEIEGSIVVAQHMPPLFTSYLAENISQVTKLKVKEVENGEILESGSAYIAPGGKQLEIFQSQKGPIAKVFDGPLEELCKPSVNILFNSIASNFPNESIGVIMTGMGEDGYIGMKEMKKSGSLLLAQSQESCVVFGMPNKPIKDGLVDEVLDIQGIADKISDSMGRG